MAEKNNAECRKQQQQALRSQFLGTTSSYTSPVMWSLGHGSISKGKRPMFVKSSQPTLLEKEATKGSNKANVECEVCFGSDNVSAYKWMPSHIFLVGGLATDLPSVAILS